MAKHIILECPGCKRRVSVARCLYDPPQATKLSLVCDQCDSGGDFHEEMYFDAAGKHITGTADNEPAQRIEGEHFGESRVGVPLCQEPRDEPCGCDENWEE